MPASSLFAEMERPTSTPSNSIPNSTTATPMDDQRALQLALELSLLGINNESSVPTSEADFVVQGLSEAERTRRSQNMTECVAVPSSEHVAEIVGRQGCKIKALRAKTNTYIKTPVRGEEPVFVVTGRKEDVGMAKREILSAAEHFSQIRACRKNNLNGSMAPGPPTNIPGQVTIQVRVPYRVVGLVVGPKGATIKRIQQQTHTYIVTPSRDKEPVFEVTGLPEAVEQARKEIEAHIAMRTGGLLDQEEAGSATAAAAAAAAAAVANGRHHHHDFGGSHTHSLDNIFTNSELMSSLYKLNSSGVNGFGGGMGGLSGGSSLNGLNALGSSSSSTTLNALNSLGGTGSPLGGTLGDINYLLGETSTSLLGSKSGVGGSLFSSLGSGAQITTSKVGEPNGTLGSLYSVDEGLGSLGSSMGSSPSFDPAPSSIWGDLSLAIGSSLSSTVNSSGSLSSTLSSLSSSLTRRSSSVSGASPPSSRLSPTLDTHPPARRISSDPTVNLPPASCSSSGSSPASTPELALAAASASAFGSLPPAGSSCGRSSSSGSCSPSGEKRCRACGENPVVAALVPCGHNLFCMECAERLASESGKCAICLEEVTQAIRIFS